MASVLRSVLKVHSTLPTSLFPGFPLTRAFPTPLFPSMDPFIRLDQMGPVDWAPGEAKGAENHPHRGFETVTYLLAGQIEHRDTRGNSGTLLPGDLQWMTAGRGLVHSELPPAEFKKSGGLFHAFQLWLNLAQKDKMLPPRYQDFRSHQIPHTTTPDGLTCVKVIAGSALGQSALVQTRSPVLFLHVKMEAGGEVRIPVPPDFNLCAFLIQGVGEFGSGGTEAKATEVVQFERWGGEVVTRNGRWSGGVLEYLLVGGRPLEEPVFQRGPFVMNTEAEVEEAERDFKSGKMGGPWVELNYGQA